MTGFRMDGRKLIGREVGWEAGGERIAAYVIAEPASQMVCEQEEPRAREPQ